MCYYTHLILLKQEFLPKTPVCFSLIPLFILAWFALCTLSSRSLTFWPLPVAFIFRSSPLLEELIPLAAPGAASLPCLHTAEARREPLSACSAGSKEALPQVNKYRKMAMRGVKSNKAQQNLAQEENLLSAMRNVNKHPLIIRAHG